MLSRRHLLALLGATGLALPGAAVPASDRRFLIVITAFGGASITDSVLAVSRERCAQAGGDPGRLTTYGADPSGPEAVRRVPGSPFSATSWRGTFRFGELRAGRFDQYGFVRRHRDHLLAVPMTASSVNHETAQHRAVTGDGAWLGRTLQEAVAAHHGVTDPLPNVLLSTGSGFVRPGTDASLEDRYRGELAPDPRRWPLSLDRAAGIPGADRRALAHATALRDELDARTPFSRTFGATPILERFRALRSGRREALEAADLVSKLLLIDGDLAAHGLVRAPEADALTARFPDLQDDPQFVQAALAFLLIKHRVSSSVTLGPGSANVFLERSDGAIDLRQLTLGFDASHTDHYAAQAWMWHRTFTLVDHLIELLASEPYDEHDSLWDHTLIYVATEFGRHRARPREATTFATGHDANNGVILLSPMLPGNRVLGGVDPATLHTYGPGGVALDASHVYALVLDALGVPAPGLPDVSRLLAS